MVLLSLALADRIRVIRQEKEEAQAEALTNERLTREALEKSDQLKDEFLANTSHELRTPLTGIIGLSESLLERSDKNQQNHLKMIIESGQRLSHLINDILDFSRIRHKDLELTIRNVDLSQMVELVIHLSEPLIKSKQLSITNAVDSGLSPIAADENRLQQILFNLIGNAIKFTSSGTIEITAQEQEEKMFISVRDTGIGINEDQLEKIFNAFEQGDASISRRFGGTGLGLPLTKQLIELHGGAISVQSKSGEGSCFTFSMPIFQGKPLTPNNTEGDAFNSFNIPLPILQNDIALESVNMNLEEQRSDVLEAPTKAHILAVDDDLINLQVLVDHLSSQHYQVTTASHGQEALDIIETSPDIDLILLDVMMPEMNGYQVCLKIRENFTSYDLPVLMLTARSQTSDLLTGMQAGANDYLTKPILKEELLARIENHLELKQSVRRLKENERLRETIFQKEKAEEEALIAQRCLIRILDMADESILSCNSEGLITFFNQSAEKRLGYPSKAILKSPISLLFPKWALEFPHSTKLVELEAQPKDEAPFDVKAIVIPLPSSEGGFVMSIASDQGLESSQGLSRDGLRDAGPPRGGLPLSLSGQASESSGRPSAFNSNKMQNLENVVAGATQTLIQDDDLLIREVRHLPSSLDWVHYIDQEKDTGEDLRKKMVVVMSLALRYWSQTTKKSKVDLAEESQIWSAYLDAKGTFTTRTFDRYLKLTTLPKNPRWRDVLHTAYFVLHTCPDSDLSLKKELETKAAEMEALLQ